MIQLLIATLYLLSNNIISSADQTLKEWEENVSREVFQIIKTNNTILRERRDRINRLQNAVILNEFEKAEKLIADGVEIDEKIDGLTALHRVACAGNREALLFLIEKGARVKEVTNDGMTVLHLTARAGFEDLVKFFLKEKFIDVNEKSFEKETALHLATVSKDRNMMDLLIENGADINAQNSRGFSPLHLTAKEGLFELTDFLIQKGAFIDKQNKNDATPLHSAIFRRHIDIVKLLMQRCVEGKAVGMGGKMSNLSPYLEMITKKSEIVPAVKALHLAVMVHSLEIANILLENGANINAVIDSDITPLHIAVLNENKEMIQFLLDHKANVCAVSKGGTVLHMLLSLKEVDDKMLHSFIQYGADVHAVDKNGWTVLHKAADRGLLKIVDLLIKKGVNINAQNSHGLSALHLALLHNNTFLVKLLMENKADIHLKTKNGTTALHYAVAHGILNIVQDLVNKDADVNAKNSSDIAPLDLAEASLNKSIAELLINRGALCPIDQQLRTFRCRKGLTITVSHDTLKARREEGYRCAFSDEFGI